MFFLIHLSFVSSQTTMLKGPHDKYFKICKFNYWVYNEKLENSLKTRIRAAFFNVKRWGKVLYTVKETIGIINYILSLEAGIT
jgi:hypothetical protein